MRLSSFLLGLVAMLVSLTTLSVALALWQNERTESWQRRVDLAQRSYRKHVELQSNIYQLFKQYGDGLLIGDRDSGRMEAELVQQIDENLETIRSLIGLEIEMMGGQEIAELAVLSQIERRVDVLTRTFVSMTEDGELLDNATRRARLVDVLDQQIDQTLSTLITRSIEEERADVNAALADTARFRGRMRVYVTATSLAVLGLAATFAWLYRSHVARPLNRLMAAVGGYGEGRLDVIPPLGGVQEFQQLGSVLSMMAEGLREREREQRELTSRLAAAVDARTSELQQLLARMERGEANRRQLMADVSHELRTPLTIIQGEAEVSLRGGPKLLEAYRESLSRIREAAVHTNRIVDDMLLIARQEAGQLRLDLQDVDLRQLLAETAELSTASVQVESTLPAAVVRADPVRLRQCILALFHNAQRYGGAHIVAQVERSAKGFVVSVEDDGPGMSDAEKAQAFERFFRGSNSSHATPDGTGLGLPIVRSIAQAHGGEVTLEDRATAGLKVSLHFPDPSADQRPSLVWNKDATRPRSA